jgi:hypothetical protein
MKTATVRGKQIKARNDDNLKKKLGVNEAQLQKFKDEEEQIIVNTKTGQMAKLNISDNINPLLEEYFNVKRVKNSSLATTTSAPLKKGVMVYGNGVPYGKKFNGVVNVIIVMFHISSENEWEINISFNINEIINSYQELINKARTLIEANYKKEFLEDFGWNDPEFQKRLSNGEEAQIKFLSLGEREMEFDLMKLREQEPLNLTKLFGNIIDFKKTKKYNCVVDYLIEKYKKISEKTLSKLGDEKGVSPKEIYNFCVKYGITCKIYNIDGKCVCEYTPDKPNKSYGGLFGIAYNNHFYPLTNNKLENLKPAKYTECCFYKGEEGEENNKDRLKRFVSNQTNKGIMYETINVYKTNILSVQYDGILYHINNDWTDVIKIGEKLGIKTNLCETMKLTTIAPIIENLYLKENVESFYPYEDRCKVYNFFNKDLEGEFITIDNNKHYMSALKNLKYLIKVDIRTAKHIVKPTNIEKGFLYIARPKRCNILMPCTKKYDGEFLEYCKNEGIEFDLLEAIEYTTVKNHYIEMIDELSKKLSEEHFKKIMCYTIGNMGKSNSNYVHDEYLKFVKIANHDETKCTKNCYVEKLNDEYNMIFEKAYKSNVKFTNKLPIHNQVLDNARKIVYEMMKKLKLTSNEIKQIRTDAITFVKNQTNSIIAKNEVKKNVKEWNKNIGLWKEVKDVIYYKNEFEYFDDEDPDTFVLYNIDRINNNTIYEDYAGSGKTYHIINKLIPSLTKSYIVLSPSHSSIKEYRALKLNCNVIQKYDFNPNLIPEEDVIIVDEIGMCGLPSIGNICKWAGYGKQIYAFGDFKQLNPVGLDKPINSDIYLNWIFNKRTSLGTNHRNNFTKQFYDELLVMNNEKDIKKIIKEHTVDWNKAEAIISYRNETRNKYNDMMLKKLKIKHGEVGEMVQCKTNDLSDKNMYNNFIYKIVSNNNGYVLSDDIEKYEVSEEQFKDFIPAYCRTVYNIQGESIKSIHYCEEDIKFLKSNVLYTVISRIKNK